MASPAAENYAHDTLSCEVYESQEVFRLVVEAFDAGVEWCETQVEEFLAR